MRRGVKAGLAVTVAMAVLAGGGFFAYRLFFARLPVGTQAHAAPTGPPSAAETRKTADAFLSAWTSGHTTRAAELTNDAPDATPALASFHSNAHMTSLKAVPGPATGRTVPFTVHAVVSYGGKRSAWSYRSSLTVVRGLTTHRPLVDWENAVLYPGLKEGETLETGRDPAPTLRVEDRHGKRLTPADYPSLSGVLDQLQTRYGKKVGGEAGIATWIDDAQGDPGKVVHVLAKGRAAVLHTTLDAKLQAAAQQAVKAKPHSAVVAVQPSTGGILAIADNDSGAALDGALAPGSTFKVITSAALLEHDKGLTPQTPVACPPTAGFPNGQQFHNVENMSEPQATLAWDFAASCNTAFISLGGKIGQDALTEQAAAEFGFGRTWNVGIPTRDGSVPSTQGNNDEKAAQMIGQGRITMSPLTMASVAATAREGSFIQPHIVAPSLIGAAQAHASRPLPVTVANDIRSMMHLTATSGTAAVPMSGITGTYVGAKTGSAEVDGQDKPNGWFIAYRDDVAAAGVVEQGGEGKDSAGPIVAAILRAS
jgi:hypothetical protein